MVWLSDGEKMRICVTVLTEYWRTDGQTDVLWRQSPRYAYASRGKNQNNYTRPYSTNNASAFDQIAPIRKHVHTETKYILNTILYHTILGRRGLDLPRTTLRPIYGPMRTPSRNGKEGYRWCAATAFGTAMSQQTYSRCSMVDAVKSGQEVTASPDFRNPVPTICRTEP